MELVRFNKHIEMWLRLVAEYGDERGAVYWAGAGVVLGWDWNGTGMGLGLGLFTELGDANLMRL